MPKPSVEIPIRYITQEKKSHKKFFAIAFPAILLLLISLAGTIWYFVFYKAAVELDRVKNLLKKVEIGNFVYFAPYEEKFVKRLLCNFEDGLDDSFPEWNTNVEGLNQLCKLGNKLLQNYLIHNDFRYLDIATKIISTIDSELTSKMNFKSNDPIFNIYDLCIHVARFFVIYQVVADDDNDDTNNDTIRKTKKICHDFIMKLIPMLNRMKVWDVTKSPELTIYANIPRLLSAYLSGSEAYKSDIKSKEMGSFKNNLKSWIPAEGRNRIDDYNFYYGVCYAFDFWKQ